MRNIYWNVLLIIACFLVPGRADGDQPRYQLTDLNPLLGGTRSASSGLNDRGDVVGMAGSASGSDHGFLLHDGTLTVLSGVPTAINNAGQIVVRSSNHTFVLSGGGYTDIGSLGGSLTDGYAINDPGQIVGISALDRPAGGVAHAFLYSGGMMQDLGNLDPTAINGNGEVVGGATLGGQPTSQAFAYAAGSVQDLGTLGGDTSIAFGVNNRGEIVGVSTLASTPPMGITPRHAFLYANGAMTDLAPSLTNSEASAINDAGIIIGFADFNGSSRAALYQTGAVWDLNTLLDQPSALTIVSANAINSMGEIVGNAITPSGDVHAVLLTPIPEPSAIALIALCGSVPLWRRSLGHGSHTKTPPHDSRCS